MGRSRGTGGREGEIHGEGTDSRPVGTSFANKSPIAAKFTDLLVRLPELDPAGS